MVFLFCCSCFMNERRHFKHFAGICGSFGFVEGGLSVFHFSCPCIIHERRHFRDFPGSCGCFGFVGRMVFHFCCSCFMNERRQFKHFAGHTFVQLRALLRRDSFRADLAPFVVDSRLGSMLSRAENRNRTCVGHRTDVALVKVIVVISLDAISLLKQHSCGNGKKRDCWSTMFARCTHSSNCVFCCAEIVAGLIWPRS